MTGRVASAVAVAARRRDTGDAIASSRNLRPEAEGLEDLES